MAQARVVAPKRARKGDVMEIKTLLQHPMETGYRRDNVGRPIPRHIIETVTVTYDGAEVFRARMTQGIAANPYLSFDVVATRSGPMVITWTDEKGQSHSETVIIEVA
jgi:sulfur-oxidizing protein SoxZ